MCELSYQSRWNENVCIPFVRVGFSAGSIGVVLVELTALAAALVVDRVEREGQGKATFVGAFFPLAFCLAMVVGQRGVGFCSRRSSWVLMPCHSFWYQK